jgi:hypothetical protein
LTAIDIVKYQYRIATRSYAMYPSPEFAIALQRERDRQVAESRLARIAACARACCAAPAGLLQRIVRVVRPIADSC